MNIKVKNRTPHAILLKNALGDTIQLNANSIKEVAEEFLIDYDTTAVQKLQPKPVINTSVLVEETVQKLQPQPVINTSVLVEETVAPVIETNSVSAKENKSKASKS